MTSSSPAPDAPDHAASGGRPDGPLTGQVVVFVTADEGVERVELTRPREAVLRAGATALLASPSGGRVVLFDHLDHAGTEQADTSIADLDTSQVSAYVLPGGVANPDRLRTDSDAVRILGDALESGVPVAVVCHGPWTLVETGELSGRTITSWPSLRTDLTNAGATWVDQQVVVCDAGPGLLISSRNPGDLDAFADALIGALSERRAA